MIRPSSPPRPPGLCLLTVLRFAAAPKVNPETRFETAAQGDPNMRTLQKGDVIQLERKGYYIVDVPLLKQGKPMVLFNVPDGKTKK